MFTVFCLLLSVAFLQGFQLPHRINIDRTDHFTCLKAADQKIGIIIVDHGSRLKEANDMLELVSSQINEHKIMNV